MTLEKVLDRLTLLLKDDKELHDAVVNYLNAQAEAKRAYSVWRLRKLETEKGWDAS